MPRSDEAVSHAASHIPGLDGVPGVLAFVEIAVDAHEQCMGYEADEARWEFEAEAAYEQWEREYYPHEFYSDSD